MISSTLKDLMKSIARQTRSDQWGSSLGVVEDEVWYSRNYQDFTALIHFGRGIVIVTCLISEKRRAFVFEELSL